jgi:outer membrane phospholipase A
MTSKTGENTAVYSLHFTYQLPHNKIRMIMNKLFIIIILLFQISVCYAAETEISAAQNKTAMSLYRDNYITFGDDNNQIKFQLSAKYQLYIPDKNPEDNEIDTFFKIVGSSAFFAYTQTSWWMVYSGRDTFSTNYQPEAFFKFDSKNSYRDLNLGSFKYFKIAPIYHCSTGVEGSDHRSINEFYGEFDISYTDEKKQNEIGINPRLFGYWSKSTQNEDINDYRHNYEANLYYIHKFDWKDNEKHFYSLWQMLKEQGFNFRCTGNPFGKGYYMIESTSKVFSANFQPKLFFQYSHGYGVNIVSYNIKETEFRGGFLFSF